MTRYYFDTCIWRDFYEDRFGPKGRPLGKYATALFMKILKNKDIVLFSEIIIRELKTDYTQVEINNALKFIFIHGILRKVEVPKESQIEAEKISKKRNLPAADVLHAILARNNKAILVSQDNHFKKLKDIAEVKKPEKII